MIYVAMLLICGLAFIIGLVVGNQYRDSDYREINELNVRLMQKLSLLANELEKLRK